MSFRLYNDDKSQITDNTNNINAHTTAIAVADRPFITAKNYSNNFPDFGNSIDNLYRILADAALVPAIIGGRTITFNNNTAATDLDLYLTVGGTNPQPLTLEASNIAAMGGSYVWDIPDTYNWSGNFTTMPAGVDPPQYNAGPTIAEFGLNQVWHDADPELRDTFDISTVPPGIGTGANNGPRSLR